ncbi:MAG TPA: hypothetical protein VE596_03390 [Gaiellaceae bacterium]|nr:hypothetical protein [Gaiellaceae bacterium]
MIEPRRRGVVYIAEELKDAVLQGPTRFYGHWESGNPADGVLDEGPGWDEIEAAIAWGRERAPVVLLRLGETGPQAHYSAGEEDTRGVLPSGGMPRRWPGGGL